MNLTAKKKIIAAILIAICAVIALIGCISCSNNNKTSSNAIEYIKEYNMYLVYAKSKNVTPLDYETWLAQIKGEKGDKGDRGEKGKSAYEAYIERHPEYTGDESQWLSDLVNGRLSDLAEYTVTFNTAGGSEIPAQKVKNCGYVDLSVAPQKDGYEFKGWTYKDCIWRAIDIVIQDMTLEAKWSLINYSITYEFNGGYYNDNFPLSYTVESGNIDLITPSKSGYLFLGWYDNELFSGEPVSKIMPGSHGDKKFYAKWQVLEYSISYELNGGTNSEYNPSSYTLFDNEINLYAPKNGDLFFAGWYLNKDFSGDKVETINGDWQKDITLYAKWIQYCTVSFNTDEGDLFVSQIKILFGENLYEEISKYQPTKANARFVKWTLNNKTIDKQYSVDRETLTLVAEYEYEYAVLVSIDNYENPNIFERTPDLDYSGYAPLNHTLTPQKIDGLQYYNGTLTPITKNYSDNIYYLQYKRLNIALTLNANYPDGTITRDTTIITKYGDIIELPAELKEFDGYIFTGWSLTKNGNPDYPVDMISSRLYPTSETPKASKIAPYKNTTLYGVWVKGRINMYGGSDVIFTFDEKTESGDIEKDVYLYRGGYFFKGEYNEDYGTYGFYAMETDLVVNIIDDTFFTYNDNSRAQTYIEYSISFASGRLSANIDDTTTIEIDSASKVTYKKNGNVVATGSLLLENGTYTATFTDGSIMNFTVSTIGDDANTRYVFQRRNEEEYGKKLLRYIVSANVLTPIDESNGYYLMLNGYGVAYLVTSSQTQGYYYNNHDGFIDLYSSDGLLAGSFKLISENGIDGYMYYNSDIDHTFTNRNDALELDGAYVATYYENGNRYQGKYVQKATSSLGGTLIFFTSDAGKSVTFVLNSEKQADKTYKYTFKTVSDNYAEYQYVQDNLINKNRIIVLNETAEDDMTIYAATKSGTFEKVASGKYRVSGNKYVFYDVESYDIKNLNLYELEDFSNDFSNISEIEFMISSDYGVIYWTKVTEKDSQTDDKGTIYNNKNGEGELILFGNKTETNDGVTTTTVGAFAIYTAADGTVYTGLFGDSDTFYYLTYTVTTISGTEKRYFCFELDHENTTYEVYQYTPYTAYAVAGNGNINAKEYINADGKGGATYVTKTKTEENRIKGKLEKTGERNGEYEIFLFVSDDGTNNFRLIVFVSGNYYVFAKKSELTATGTYTTAEGAELTLDGYIFATYITADNQTISNAFYFKTDVENQIVLTFSSDGSTSSIYFDLNENNKSFSVRGSEYGTYVIIDNQYITGMIVEFDGYGLIADYGKIAHAAVRDYERNADGSFKYDAYGNLIQIVVDENAFYKIEFENGKNYIYFRYTALNSDIIEMKCLITSVTSNNQTIPAVVVVHTEVEQTYVNPNDWSVLILTSYGVARRIDGRTGIATTGNYTIITLDEESDNGLLYFSAGESSAIYRYNTETREAYERRFAEQGYYTEDLSALYFSVYGYATYAKGDSSTTYFYDTDDDGNITVYHQDWYAAEHDEKYGFVKEDFGKHDDIKEFNGDTYLATTGRDISFEKADAEMQKFPVQYDSNTKVYFGDIVFRPSGKDEFSSGATIILHKEDGNKLLDKNGKEVVYIATVKREWKDEAKTEKRTYIQIPLSNGANYEFDIDFTYGETNHSTYKITSMKWTISGSGYYYNVGMMNLYIKAMQGQDVSSLIDGVRALNYGTIGFTRVYKSDGTIESESVDASFTNNCLLKDSDGKLWTIEGSTPDFVPGDEAANTLDRMNMSVTGNEGEVFKASGSGYKINLYSETTKQKYTAVIAFQSMASVGFSGYGFYFAAINAVSEHEVTDQNGTTYKVTAERVIATENTSAVQLGSIYYDITLTDKDGNAITGTNSYYYGKDENGDTDYSKLWYIVRTVEDGKVISSKAFELVFTGSTTVDGAYTPFETVTVKSYDLKVAYTSDEKAFVEYTEDADGNKTVVFYSTIGSYVSTNLIKKCELTETGHCVITLYDDSQYIVKFTWRNYYVTITTK